MKHDEDNTKETNKETGSESVESGASLPTDGDVLQETSVVQPSAPVAGPTDDTSKPSRNRRKSAGSSAPVAVEAAEKVATEDGSGSDSSSSGSEESGEEGSEVGSEEKVEVTTTAEDVAEKPKAKKQSKKAKAEEAVKEPNLPVNPSPKGLVSRLIRWRRQGRR